MNVEILATSYVKETIAATDLLSPCINEGDKEPSWDGNIYLYSNAAQKKAGVKKIPVQVKGKTENTHPNQITYRMDVDDIDNYLRDGGIILFVVYISKDGKKNRIYYECLLPIKIRVLKEQNKGKKKIPIECKPFPTESEKKVSICMNFYEDMQRQRSFALSELKTIEELEKQGVLEGLTMPFVAFGSQKNDIKSVLFQNTPYMYAKIKGSAVLQPLEMIPVGIHVSENVDCRIYAGGKLFYTSARREHSADKVDFCIGNSFRIICEDDGENKKFSFTYSPSKQLPDALVDTEFMIAFVENGGLQIDDAPLSAEQAKEKWGNELPALKEQLEYCQKVKSVLEAFALPLDINIQNTTDAEIRKTERFYRGIIKGEAIEGLNPNTPPVATVDYYGKKLLISFNKIAEPGTYYIYDFNVAPTLFSYTDGTDEHFLTSRYEILKPEDYLTLSNITLPKVLESYKELSDKDYIYERANMAALIMLTAYDQSGDKRTDLLQCAYDIETWLAENTPSDKALLPEIRKINLWQIKKRMGSLSQEDKKDAFQIAEDTTQPESIRVGAYLILDNQLAAESHFSKMEEREQQELKKFPIFRFWSHE